MSSKASKIVALLGHVKQKSLRLVAKDVLVYLALLVTILLSAARIMATGSGAFPDSEIYALAGRSYVHGQSPDRLNPGHPPLSKYLIGISETVFGSEVAFSLVFGALTLLVVYFLSRRILPSYFALLPSVLIALDRMFLWLSSVSLLDIYVTFFSVAYVFLFLRFRNAKWQWALLGFTIGLAVASKWTGAFAFPALVAFAIVKKDRRALSSLLLALPVAAVTYMATYGVFFLSDHSLQDFVSLQFEMARFQANLRFGRGTPPAFWLWFNLLTGIEGPAVMAQGTALKNVQSTSIQYGLTTLDTFNPLTWPLCFSATLLTLAFAWKGRDRVALLPALAFISFLGIMSYGQLYIWNLLPALPFGFVCLAYAFWKGYDWSEGTTRATVLLAGYLVVTFLWSFFGRLPAFIRTG